MASTAVSGAPRIRPCWSYSSSAVASPCRSRSEAPRSHWAVNRTGSASWTWPSRSASSVMAPPPSTAASCSWSPASTSLKLFRAAYSVSAARWVMEIMEPSSARIREPGGTRPSVRSVRSRVVLAATWTPAARSSLVAFWEVAVPNTGPSHTDAAVARTQVFPVPAGPVTISAVRAEVRTCQTAAAWSSRSPRAAACSRVSCPRPRSSASSTAWSAPRRRAARSPVRRGAPWVCVCATSLSSRVSCAVVAYRAAPGRV